MREIKWTQIEKEDTGYESTKKMDFLQTQFGIIPASETGLTDDDVDFWFCHTNFDVSPDVLVGVERIEGVATLEPFSRYHFRVGIPKSGFFESEKVKGGIKHYLIHEMDLDTVVSKYIDQLYVNSECNILGVDDALLYKLKDSLDNLYSNWLIYGLPNGETSVYVCDMMDEDFIKLVDLVHNTQILVGGKVFTKYGG